MAQFKDLTGQRFGRLTVLECIQKATRQGGATKWLCACDCGKTKTIRSVHLINGSTKSCGCLQREIAASVNTKHGLKGSRVYDIFENMLERCYNHKNPAFHNYGGRGIAVCDEWKNNFQSFYDWATTNGYTDKLTLDRKNNDKGYSPDNCRWATRKEQSRNTRSNVLVTINGVTKILSDWATEAGIYRKTLSYRLKSGWNPIDAVTIPPVIGRNQSSVRR